MTEYLIFQAGDHTLGVAVENVREVVRAATLSRPAGQTDEVEGVLNLRGSVVPVIDLAKYFRMTVPALSVSDFLVILGDQQDRLCAVRSCSEVRLESNAELVGGVATDELGQLEATARQIKVGSLIVPLLEPDRLADLAQVDAASSARTIPPVEVSHDNPGGSA